MHQLAVRMIAVTGLCLWLAACLRSTRSESRITGTCEGACSYYMRCKQVDDSDALQMCINECSDFFSDVQALAELERLDCEEVVGFIDGVPAPR